MTWLSGWGRRKSITASRAAGAVTNYPIKILVGESSGSPGADVHCGGNVRSDFADLRFTTSDWQTLLDYYIEQIDGTTPNQVAHVWVEFDSIGTSATTFYLYYDKSDAASVSDGAATFLFFEDFEALTLGDLNGQNGWSGNSAFDVQNSVAAEGSKAVAVTGAAGGIDRSISGVNGWDLFVQIRMRATSLSTSFQLQLYLYEGGSAITGVSLDTSNLSHLRGGPVWDSMAAYSADTWYKAKIALTSASAHRVWIDDVEQSLSNNSNYNSVAYAVNTIRLEQYPPPDNCYADQIIVGQYMDDGPTISGYGSEERLGYDSAVGAAALVITALNPTVDFSFAAVVAAAGLAIQAHGISVVFFFDSNALVIGGIKAAKPRAGFSAAEPVADFSATKPQAEFSAVTGGS